MSITSLLQQAKDKLFPISDFTFNQYDAKLNRIFKAVSDVLCHLVKGEDCPDRKRVYALMRHITYHAPDENNWLGTDNAFIKACKQEVIFKLLAPALALRVLILSRNGKEPESSQLAKLLTAYGLYVGPLPRLPELPALSKASTKVVENCQKILKQFKEQEASSKKALGVARRAFSKIQQMGQKGLCDRSTFDALIDCVLLDIETPPSCENIFHVAHKCTVITQLITQWKKGIITQEGFTALVQKLPRQADFRIGGWSVDSKGFLIENCTPNADAVTGSWCKTYTIHHRPDGTSQTMGITTYQVM